MWATQARRLDLQPQGLASGSISGRHAERTLNQRTHVHACAHVWLHPAQIEDDDDSDGVAGALDAQVASAAAGLAAHAGREAAAGSGGDNEAAGSGGHHDEDEAGAGIYSSMLKVGSWRLA